MWGNELIGGGLCSLSTFLVSPYRYSDSSLSKVGLSVVRSASTHTGNTDKSMHPYVQAFGELIKKVKYYFMYNLNATDAKT